MIRQDSARDPRRLLLKMSLYRRMEWAPSTGRSGIEAVTALIDRPALLVKCALPKLKTQSCQPFLLVKRGGLYVILVRKPHGVRRVARALPLATKHTMSVE